MTHHTLDVKRLLCPMPVIKAQNFVKQSKDGDVITLIATDPGALHDVPSWCRISGHEVIETTERDGAIEISFKVCKTHD